MTWWDAIEVLIVTGATTARVEANNTGIKNIKRTGRGFRNPPENYRIRILLTSAAKNRSVNTHHNRVIHHEPRRAMKHRG